MNKFFAVLLLMTFESGCRNAPPPEPPPEPGISLNLAEARAASLADVRYLLAFDIPGDAASPVTGRATIRFTSKGATTPLVLDFSPGPDALQSVSIGGRPAAHHAVNGHIVIAKELLVAGENTVEIAFRAGDGALNRNPDFLYTLFVPARAHQVFPCFDQPDIKARYTLELTMPTGWESLANGAEISREAADGRIHPRFGQTAPIPTYLFAFAAGKFQIETAERDGRTYRMFHRETDAKKVARNRDAVFDLHASSLKWLEAYAAIPYAFGKFDFVLIPSFQFSGMEHPGAVYYNASTLLLDESATENQMLNRASTIAHETAHM
jgi:aminopeptidase N